jgi:hypothetical protein
MKKLLLALFISFNAYAAEEPDALCELYKAKSELTSALAASPYIYGSSNENSTATIALGYSLAGLSKGGLAKDIANAKCESVINTYSLDEQQRWALVSVHKAAAKSEIVLLLKAKELSLENVAHIERQLKAQTATLAEYTSAKQVSIAIDNKITQLKAILAEPSQPIDLTNVKSLLDKARVSEGKVAELIAKQESIEGWDVILGAGAQKDLNNTNSEVKPFVGLTFKWSFGNYGVNDSIANIRNKTEKVFNSSQVGYAKSAERLLYKVEELLVVEKSREELLLNAVEDTNRILLSFKNIDTSLAISTRKALEVQSLVYGAELAGVRSRISKYSDIATKN